MSHPAWVKFRSVIDGLGSQLFHQKDIKWFRLKENMDNNSEGVGIKYDEIDLKCLIGYNDFRTWPIEKATESGIADPQSLYILFNKKYLSELGFINSNGYFKFNSNGDYFIIDGIKYQDTGDTLVSQAGLTPVFFMLILQKKEPITGSDVY